MKKIPSFYLYLQKILLEKSGMENKLNLNEVKRVFRYVRIPKNFVIILVRELEKFGLVKKENQEVEVINLERSNTMDFSWKNDNYNRKNRRILYNPKFP